MVYRNQTRSIVEYGDFYGLFTSINVLLVCTLFDALHVSIVLHTYICQGL